MSSTFEVSDADIGQRIQRVRTQKGMSQADFANALGISVRAYQNYERGDRPVSKQLLCALKAAFGVSSDYILDGEESAGSADNLRNVVRPDLLQAIGEEIERQRVAEVIGFDHQQTYSVAAIIYTDLVRRLGPHDIGSADFSDNSSRVFREIQAEVAEYIRVTKETIALYQRSSQAAAKGSAQRAHHDDSSTSTVSQSFHGSVGQVGGHDIHNYGDKKDK